MTTRAETRAKNGPNRNTQRQPGMPSRAQAQNGGDAAPDELYGVVSVLYHALQGNETYTKYCNDARKAGDDELVEFFESCRTEEHGRAQRAKMLLAERLEDDMGEEEDDDEDENEAASPDDEDDDDDT